MAKQHDQVPELTKDQKYDKIKEQYEKVTPLAEQLKEVEVQMNFHKNEYMAKREQANQIKKQIRETSTKIDEFLK